MTDTENDTHLGTSEKYAILTSAVAETWDKILSSGLGNEYVKNVAFSTVADQREYAIATVVSAGDFYKVSQMCVNEGSGSLRPIERVHPDETWGYRAPNTVVTMKLYYFPCAPVWTDGTGSFDGINGWEEHTLVTAAITVKAKKEDDYSVFARRKQELEKRMGTMANRDAQDPPRVIRRARTAQRASGYFHPYNQNVSAWDIRGINFELLYRFGVNV